MSQNIKGLPVIQRDSAKELPAHGMYIAGKWTDASERGLLEIVSPATGEPIGYVNLGTREDARRAIAAANEAKTRFGRMGVWERANLCHAVADVIDARADDLARLLTLEQGKPLHAEARGEVKSAATAFRAAAEQIKWLESASFPVADPNKRAFNILQPKGVFAVITPWNFPLGCPSIYYLAPGLATGNTMVWVPAPTTSISAVKLLECFEEAGVPAGVVNLVTGEGPVVGDEIVSNPGTDAIAFTGSSETGHAIAKRGAGKSLLLEMGGNGPTIVMDDADVAVAAARVARGCYANAGQICTATERILVHRHVHDRFIELLVEESEKVRLGDPFDEATTMGPLNNEPTAGKMDDHLQDALAKGARIVLGGGRAEAFPTRLYYQPTVVTDVTKDSLLNLEETFGPVAPVLAFSSDEEALELADASPYGLSGAVFTQNIKRALTMAERLRVGIVNINEASSYWETHIPAGGASGKSSGIGRTGGKHTLLEMSDLKTITIDIA
jgi:acyl-CoA reductase-like NAD-dependent aldehyde dehydrogenase